MNLYLENIVNQLKNHSKTLERTSLFIDKPWALIDNDLEIQKLIFKKDKELVISKNGQVQIGKWDYYPQAKSLMIDRNYDKILCNEAFINDGVMILKMDGTNNRFFILANENVIPDLDVNRYLEELKYRKLKIIETQLIDGKTLEIYRDGEWPEPVIGDKVTINAENIVDGNYQLATPYHYIEIKRGRIYKLLMEIRYYNEKGQEILIQQQDDRKIKRGDYVYMFGEKIKEGIIDFSKSKNLIVSKGIVIRLEPKNEILNRINKIWLKFWEGTDD